jgi:hypothetical protein
MQYQTRKYAGLEMLPLIRVNLPLSHPPIAARSAFFEQDHTHTDRVDPDPDGPHGPHRNGKRDGTRLS